MDDKIIRIEPYGKPERVIDVAKLGADLAGHGGGDSRLIDELLKMLHDGKVPSGRMTTLSASAESHFIAFAAEKSRLNGGAAIEVASVRE